MLVNSLDLGGAHPFALPIVGQTVGLQIIEGAEQAVWARGSVARKQTVTFWIQAWQGIGGAAAGSSASLKYLLKQVEELASNAQLQPCYIQWTATAQTGALLNASELHDGWYVIDDFEPNYQKNVVMGICQARMTVTQVAPGAPRRVSMAYSGGALSSNFSGGALNLLALPVGSTAQEANFNRTGGEGAIPCILSPVASPEPFVLSATIANIFKGGVHVYDTINTGSNAVPTAASGLFVNANWVEVFYTDHNFVGDCVITNGLQLLLFQTGQAVTSTNYLWNTAAANVGWQQYGTFLYEDNASAIGTLRAYTLARVGMEECSLVAVDSSATPQMATKSIRLQRGRYEYRSDFRPLSQAATGSLSNALALPATPKIIYNSTLVADVVLSETSPAFATDYGFGAAIIASTAQPFIAGFLYQNEPVKQPFNAGNSATIGLGDSTSLAINAQRSYGVFAVPYGTSGVFSPANLQAEAEGGTLDAGWTSVANAAMSAGNEAKCAATTVATHADVFGTAFVPAVGAYDAWFRYRVTSNVGNATEMQMGLWDSTSSAFVASTIYAANQGQYSSVIRPDSPAAYWRLDDAATPAVDIANAHNGVVTAGTFGVTPSATADGDTAMTFNGTTSVITVPTAASLHPGDTFSIEAWFKTTAIAGAELVDSGAANDYQLGITGAGKLFAQKRGVATIMTSTGAYNDGVWHHVVWTKATTTNHLYVDGVDVTPAVTNAAIVGGATSITIGNGADGFFAGSLDEVAFYGVALSPVQVAAHYAARLLNAPVWLRAATNVTPTAAHNMRFRCVTTATLGTDWFIDEAVMVPKTLVNNGPQEIAQQFAYDRGVKMVRP